MRGIFPFLILSGILLIGEWTSSVLCVLTDQAFTENERKALDELNGRAVKYVPHDYMKEDDYLIRWLRAKNLDVEKADDMLRENIKWREENKMDTILSEDFSDFDRDYPYQTHFHDKQGKPIITVVNNITTKNFGDWDISKLARAGRLHTLYRHIDRAFENATQQVRNLESAGKNITQWDIVTNMRNYTVIQHGCLQCIPFHFHAVNSYEKHYPGLADKILLINTPRIYELILKLVTPLMSPMTRNSLKVYNSNKDSWQAELLKIVDRDQLPPEFFDSDTNKDIASGFLPFSLSDVVNNIF